MENTAINDKMFTIETIKVRFTFAVLVIVLALTLAIMAFIYFFVGGILADEVYDRLTATAGYSSQRIDNWFIERRVEVDVMYHIVSMLPDDEVTLQALIALVTYMGWNDEGERSLHGSGWIRTPGWYPTQRPWWAAAMATPNATVFSPVYIDARTGELAVTISRYLGIVRGYTAVYAKDVFIVDVIDMVRDSIIVEGSYAFLVDKYNNILAHTNNEYLLPVVADGIMHLTNIRDVSTYSRFSYESLAENEVVLFRDNYGVGWYIAASEVHETGWMLYVAVPESYVSYRIISLMIGFSIFWFPSIILIVSLIWYVTKKIISNPVAKRLMVLMEQEKQSHEQTRKFLDLAPFFVEIWDKNGNLIECNEPAAKLFGLSDKDEYILRYNEFSPEIQPCGTPSLEKARKYIEVALAQGSSHMEWMHIGPDGELIPVHCTLARLERERGGEPIILIYSQDLRPIKNALEKEREAEEGSQAKTRFLARMSHEIRTPMNSVMGIAEIELRKNSHSKETEEAFQRIYNSSKLLLGIINDILDLSRVEAGKMEIVPDVYETASLIADVVQLNLMYIESKRIEFRLEVDENLPIYLIGDELRIKQILNNLLSNAFKYTAEGEISLSFGLADTQSVENAMLVVRVTDTGQGLDKEQISELFGTEYTRFNLEQNRMVEGSGLGMVIAHSLVKMMDGEIEVSSTPGVGSTFTVSVLQSVKGDEVLGIAGSQSLKNFEISRSYMKKIQQLDIIPMPYGRVLVVDDVETNLYVAEAFLEPYELAIEIAESGIEAINRIKAGEVYDIIFMDHMMPKMDGIEATKIIRDMGYNHPIVALTANATVGASQMFMNNGFSGFISKPLNLGQMDECLMKFIHDKHIDSAT